MLLQRQLHRTEPWPNGQADARPQTHFACKWDIGLPFAREKCLARKRYDPLSSDTVSKNSNHFKQIRNELGTSALRCVQDLALGGKKCHLLPIRWTPMRTRRDDSGRKIHKGRPYEVREYSDPSMHQYGHTKRISREEVSRPPVKPGRPIRFRFSTLNVGIAGTNGVSCSLVCFRTCGRHRHA